MKTKLPELNDQQAAAVEALQKFVTRSSGSREIMLQGSAGTGKTTCINALVSVCRGAFVFTAPTNKATKVLTQMVDTYLDGIVPTTTIFKLLGLRLDTDGEVREIVQDADKAKQQLDMLDVVVIDEASMVNASLKRAIDKALIDHPRLKIIYMGDPFQLPPVNESRSLAFSVPEVVTLTKVMRHDNEILTLATSLRDCILNQTVPTLLSANSEDGGVFCVKRARFYDLLAEGCANEKYETQPNYLKAIAWRNAMVSHTNEFIRQRLYGEAAAKVGFQVGEKVVACAPVLCVEERQRGGYETLMTTDEEGIVQAVRVGPHPIYGAILCYHLTIAPESGADWITAVVPHEDGAAAAAALTQRLADLAKSKRGSWSAFWSAKETLHDVRPCHAITAHRSQGSTYEMVFVNAVDILSNQRIEEALKCLYVAASRPSRVLVINK